MLCGVNVDICHININGLESYYRVKHNLIKYFTVAQKMYLKHCTHLNKVEIKSGVDQSYDQAWKNRQIRKLRNFVILTVKIKIYIREVCHTGGKFVESGGKFWFACRGIIIVSRPGYDSWPCWLLTIYNLILTDQ